MTFQERSWGKVRHEARMKNRSIFAVSLERNISGLGTKSCLDQKVTIELVPRREMVVCVIFFHFNDDYFALDTASARDPYCKITRLLSLLTRVQSYLTGCILYNSTVLVNLFRTNVKMKLRRTFITNSYPNKKVSVLMK